MGATNTAEKIDFEGQVALVTGGAQGIGRGICEAFAELGADVAIADVDVETAGTTAAAIEDETDATVLAVEADVADYDAVTDGVETVLDEFGAIDHLVNNAGLGETVPFRQTEPSEWDHQLGVSLRGTLNCSHAVLDHLVERETGTILNVASDAYRGNGPGLAIYGAAKAAVVSFTKTLSREVGDHGVRVNCVSPGTVYTPTTADWIDGFEEQILEPYALSRLGEPTDVADAAAFLCSDAADWITGQVLSVNGGNLRG